MNGIEPPTPMSTGSVPSQASANAAARRVVRRTGRVDLRRLAGVDDGDGQLGAPRDVLLEVRDAARPRRSAWCRRGAIRSEILARAAGTRVLLAPSTLGASRPMTASAGLGPQPRRQRSRADPAATPASGAGLGAQPVLGVVDVGGRAGVQPGDRDVAVVVVQGRDQPGQRDQRVGHQPAPHAGVHGVREGATSTSTRTRPRRLVVRAGTPMSQLPESAITMTSAREPLAVLVQERRQGRRADLLLALDEHRRRRPAGRRRGTRSAAQVRRRCRPCRRRRRGRRAGRRARSARTAAESHSAWSFPAAGRRGGRTAAPSAHPPAPAGARARPAGRHRPAAPRHRTMPAPSRRAATGVSARTQLDRGGRIGRHRGDAHQPLQIRSHRGKNSREGAPGILDRPSARVHADFGGESIGHLDHLLQLGMPHDDHPVADERWPASRGGGRRSAAGRRARRARRTRPAAGPAPRRG